MASAASIVASAGSLIGKGCRSGLLMLLQFRNAAPSLELIA
jgi:hypothetical protein